MVSRVKRPIKPSGISFFSDEDIGLNIIISASRTLDHDSPSRWVFIYERGFRWVSSGLLVRRFSIDVRARGGFLFLIKTLSTMTHMQMRSLVFQQEVFVR